MRSIIVHYQEIALKGNNRPWFVSRLARNLRTATKGTGVKEVRVLMGRIEILLEDDADWKTVRDRVTNVFGIANFSLARSAPLNVEAIASQILEDLGARDVSTFRVSARRADKRFPLTSPQLEREVGGLIKLARGWTVKLSKPELTIHVEGLTDKAFYYFDKQPGAGGLPAGTSGRVACLLSGGIDSPVAAWRLLRRGCRVTFIHFHSYPILSRASQEKARELVTLLTRFQYDSRLFLVPFGEIQQRVVLAVAPPLRVVIYRRLMMRIAEAIARRNRAQALVTGDVVGQVASQTLENMAAINDVVRMPVLRPLVGLDKEEITAEAQRLGTFEISIIPDQDCCTLFTPRHPATKSRRTEVERAEAGLPITDIVTEAVNAAVIEQFHFPARPVRARGARENGDTQLNANSLTQEGGGPT
ncbi:MAG: tRNA 4-thiouridine(8) synthase ThiI [Acidobacteriota bacterium]|nr:tRNA 4-thiouridine(8) synthase ThiI [Acidobacteriota bacterium]